MALRVGLHEVVRLGLAGGTEHLLSHLVCMRALGALGLHTPLKTSPSVINDWRGVFIFEDSEEQKFTFDSEAAQNIEILISI